MRQVEFADRDLDVDAEVIFAAEDFGDAAAGILRGARPVGDFYVDDDAFEVRTSRRGGQLLRPERDLRTSSSSVSSAVQDFQIFHHRGHRGHRGFGTPAFGDHDFLRDLCVYRRDVVSSRLP